MSDGRVRTRFKEPIGRPNFILAWRKYRNYTQEQLAEMAGMSPGNLSLLENRKQNYTQATLEALAEALNCSPGDLLMRDPTDSEALWSLWESAKPADRRRIVQVVQAMLRTAER